MSNQTPPKPPSSPPLIWVKQGKEQQPAFLLEDGDGGHLIRWASTDRVQWVRADQVERQLKSRRPEGRDVFRKRAPGERLNFTESPTLSRKRSRNRVSLSPVPTYKGIALDSPKLPSNAEEHTNDDYDGSRNISNSDSDGDNDDDDGEVEFLLTIQPQSPKQKKQSSQPIRAMTGMHDGSKEQNELRDPASQTRPEDVSLEDSKSSKCPPQQQESNSEVAESSVSTDSFRTSSPPFSDRSSAYLQSLAEICHTILWDKRWRVGPENRRLFAWEHGEDMSAVTTLSRCYEPPPPATKKACSCLLCCDPNKEQQRKSPADFIDTTDDDSERYGRVPERVEQLMTSLPGISDDTTRDRCLNLYSRLFSRKGPWFRVDDLLKYYTTKRSTYENTQEGQSTHLEGKTKAAAPASNAPNSPSKFFLPRSQSSTRRNGAVGSKSFENRIDWQLVDHQVQSFALLVDDLQQLFQMGLIRSFRDEEECGKTVGEVQKYGLLRMEEQDRILSKLGGSKSKRKSIEHEKFSPRGPTGSKSVYENRIWKQMSQQQSISCLHNNAGCTKLRLLPVTKHVDEVLIHSLSSTIVLKAGKQDYIPSPVFRAATEKVMDTFQEILARHKNFLARVGGGASIMCLRLREAPVSTLRRVCRLYLCATSGPGDMRGDGTNGWRSVADWTPVREHPVTTQTVLPPGAHTWHHVSYPGRDYRFKLTSCNFTRAYVPRFVSDDSVEPTDCSTSTLTTENVFSNIESFHLWEKCVELRANVDYLLELNELTLYNERRRARGNGSRGSATDESVVDESKQSSNSEDFGISVDFLDLLTHQGRNRVADAFQRGLAVSSDRFAGESRRNLDQDVSMLLGEKYTNEDGIEVCPPPCRFKNDCEKVLAIIAALSIHILESRNQLATSAEIADRSLRPWLRHLFWEGCLAYLLWDIVPVIERRNYYDFAVKALECLVFGGKPWIQTTQPDAGPPDEDATFARFYLSRRARGKAYERLVIDRAHLLREAAKDKKPKSSGEENSSKGRRATRAKKIPKLPTPQEASSLFCLDLIKRYAPCGQITFSAIRTLARRLRKPLSQTLLDVDCVEVIELGHRLATPGISPDSNKYSDWTPVTDKAVANSMGGEDNLIGKRCSYIGFEADENPLSLSSLNVEELSMEYYRSGKLPDDNVDLKGGWEGWHDEGGKVRALFRVLCSAPILGMDWGCSYEGLDQISRREHVSIHLTPYQRAPFDLHVGAETAISADASSRGFYERRHHKIDQFLRRLELLKPQELCDLVFNAVSARVDHATETNRDDPTLEADVLQVRTLSLLAAGFGAKQLSSIFRCFFYDYRHYSGGLPDLLLVRAIFSPTADEVHGSLVDLCEWVNEAPFSAEFKQSRDAEKVTNFLEDRDAEFLGCSKVGDSGGQGRRSTRTVRRQQQPPNGETVNPNKRVELPSKLHLFHKDREILVECMLVEVKSHNDRLDPRQEDWLNILDRHGNARVCKFVKSKPAKKESGGNNKFKNEKEGGH